MQRFLEDTNDMRLVPGPEHETALMAATKQCNDLKLELIRAQEKESVAEMKQQSARDQLAVAEDNVHDLETQLSGLESQEAAGLSNEQMIQEKTLDLVLSARRLVDVLANRIAPGRDSAAKPAIIAASHSARPAGRRDLEASFVPSRLGDGLRLRQTLVAEKQSEGHREKQVLFPVFLEFITTTIPYRGVNNVAWGRSIMTSSLSAN